jgi:hypothetical protein
VHPCGANVCGRRLPARQGTDPRGRRQAQRPDRGRGRTPGRPGRDRDSDVPGKDERRDAAHRRRACGCRGPLAGHDCRRAYEAGRQEPSANPIRLQGNRGRPESVRGGGLRNQGQGERHHSRSHTLRHEQDGEPETSALREQRHAVAGESQDVRLGGTESQGGVCRKAQDGHRQPQRLWDQPAGRPGV